MADSKHWAKSQAQRLEEARAQELELRQMWWQTQKAKKEEQERKMEAKGWTWGSWWWGQSNWSTEEWRTAGGASSSQSNDPPPEPEPTASSSARSNAPQVPYPSRSLGEDHMALRHAALSPASFVPQRHVTMALGRPVVVLTDARNAFGAFGGGCVVLEEG